MITIDSMHNIGEMLETNTTLKCLYVNNNNLGDDGIDDNYSCINGKYNINNS